MIEDDEFSADDGALFGRIADLNDAALDAEAAAQDLHNEAPTMEAGGLLMMPSEQHDHQDDATGIAH